MFTNPWFQFSSKLKYKLILNSKREVRISKLKQDTAILQTEYVVQQL